MFKLIISILLTITNFTTDENQKGVCLSSFEVELASLINEYRQTKGLSAIPISAALSRVARAHAHDLDQFYKKSDRCNPHSWSKNGNWTSCCYTDDHKKASCMWDKPKEIANYQDPGFEIVYWHSVAASPTNALKGWQKSQGHNEMIINASQWKQAQWKAMGVSIYKYYAVVWFGQLEDSEIAEDC